MNDALISLFTLTILEIVLGIDNIIFVTILAGKTEESKQGRARTIGLLMGMVVRIVLLFGINWIQRQDHTLFEIAGHEFSGMSLLLLAGGLFLLFQSVREIHLKMVNVKSPPFSQLIDFVFIDISFVVFVKLIKLT